MTNHLSALPEVLASTLLFALLHSATASLRCKRWMYRIGLREPGYRRAYVLLSLLAVGAWFAFLNRLPDAPLYAIDGVAAWALRALQALGVVLALAALWPIDVLAFLGLRAHASGDPFVERGIYRYLRHPMYSGVMLILLAQPTQSVNHAAVSLALCLYFILGARWEERRMLRQHPSYAEYRARVPAFLPHPRLIV